MEDTEMLQLLTQKLEWEDTCQHVKNKRFEALVNARNNYVITRLQQNKDRYMPEGVTLAVHCVSNSHCKTYTSREELAGPRLSMEATGIPALRKWLLDMAAPSLLRVEEHIIGRANIFVRGVSLWVDNTPDWRRTGVLDIIQEPGKTWDNSIDTFLTEAKAATHDQLIDRLQTGKGATLSAAIRYVRLLKAWNASTLRVFFYNNGNHETLSLIHI